MRIFWAVILILAPNLVLGQFRFLTHIPVAVEGEYLANPWAGGLNSGQYGNLDINMDGQLDLVVFDRSSNRFNPFLNVDGVYVFAPEYAYFFPEDINGWVLFRDYNCDGLNDIFTDALFGIKVYLNSSSGSSPLSWILMEDPIFTEGFNGLVNIQLNITDIPGIEDIDGDGDLDILVYDFAVGGYIEYHKNLSIETYGNCDSLVYRRETQQWGDFMECDCDQIVFGDEECSPREGGRLAHAGGKSLLVLDMDGDGDLEVGFGQEQCNTFYLLENVGSNNSALFTGIVENFPDSQAPVSFPQFPAVFNLDVDFDGIKDLVATPNVFANSIENSIDFVHSNWFYQNLGTNETPNFVFAQNDFLQDQMIDVGEEAVPALADFDDDGDLDLFVGGRGGAKPDEFYATLYLFENIGSRIKPIFQLSDSDYLGLSSLRISHLKPSFVDLNRDGNNDLILATTNRFGLVQVQYILGERTGDYDLSKAGQMDLDVNSEDNLFFSDLNNDHIIDLLIGRAQGRLEFWRGADHFQFVLESEEFAGIGDNSLYRHLAPLVDDFNNDRQLELAVADASGRFQIYGQRFGSFEFDPAQIQENILESDLWENSISLRAGSRTTLASGDLTGDGNPDILLGDRQGGVIILENTDPNSVLNPSNESKLKMIVSPNPSNGLLKILTNQNARIEIFSVLGQKILAESTIKSNEVYPLDLRNLSGGIYLIQGRGTTGRDIQKIVIQK